MVAPRRATFSSSRGLASERKRAWPRGHIVGPYRLFGQSGSGHGVGVARGARGWISRRRVALKLPRVLFIDGGLAARMARERDILAALVHPISAALRSPMQASTQAGGLTLHWRCGWRAA